MHKWRIKALYKGKPTRDREAEWSKQLADDKTGIIEVPDNLSIEKVNELGESFMVGFTDGVKKIIKDSKLQEATDRVLKERANGLDEHEALIFCEELIKKYPTTYLYVIKERYGELENRIDEIKEALK